MKNSSKDNSPGNGTIALGVNIDHVATLRQARYRQDPAAHNAEPSPLEAALAAERAGAAGITAHLRLDRRHIQDDDILRLRGRISTKLNLEMGNTPEILEIALRVMPEDVCLVPENRQEISTEGGLDCIGQFDALQPTLDRLRGAGIRVSLFVDPEPGQLEKSAALGAEFVELHTGAFANAIGATAGEELTRLIEAAKVASGLGLRVNAGHGINYTNIREILRMPHLVELNIGHSIVARAMSVGMEAAVREMLVLMRG